MLRGKARKLRFRTLFVFLLIVVFDAIAWTQPTGHCTGDEKEAAFEVTSVRESAPAAEYSQVLLNEPTSGDFRAENFFLSQLIGEAFYVDSRFQVLGLPDWIKQRRYQVVAKADDCREALRKMDLPKAKLQKQLMIQALLRDRFHLKFRVETRLLPAGTLLRSAKGVKMDKDAGSADQPDVSSSDRSAKGVEIIAKHMSLESLALLLQGYLRTTISNETHLDGTYSFDLRFKQTQTAEDGQNTEAWPPVDVALEQQLGLKLVERKQALPVIVVEHIELPTPN